MYPGRVPLLVDGVGTILRYGGFGKHEPPSYILGLKRLFIIMYHARPETLERFKLRQSFHHESMYAKGISIY
jgi:hypothetical protein